MTYLNNIQIRAADSPSIDGFGRWRTSEVTTLLDSKQLWDSDPLFWDDGQTAGAGTTSTHSVARASTTMLVANATAGTRVRQTFQRFNYQAGKSHLVLMTGILDRTGGGAGIVRRFGYFDASNGIFLEDDEGTINLVHRTSVSGAPVDNQVARASWNLDPMDGTGPSGVNLDFSKAQILFVDMEWLGVGRVRAGFVVAGKVYYAHEFLHANLLDSVYMSNPNLPLRWEISNDGTGVESTLEHVCGSVMTEGGVQETGMRRARSTSGTHVDADVADTLYAVIGIRQKSTHLNSVVTLAGVSMVTETNDAFEWQLRLNPTVAGVFTYADETNSAVQTAQGVTANTVSGGYLLDSGWSVAAGVASAERLITRTLGSSIAGTPDTIVLCVRPLSNGADIQGTLMWREAR